MLFQKALMAIVHTYAKEYKWTKDYILENVYIDEHFLLSEIIESSRKSDLLMQYNLQMMPQASKEDRQNFVDMLTDNARGNSVEIKDNQKTDFQAIREAKMKMAR
ncbi:hypothetical protein [Jeotgalibacillus malaysiensis]|uniref:hypothetical protein n=1 Tax=Jeotgalibacillus malaysiensis TaxID=1508404 RepID=UPI00384B8673